MLELLSSHAAFGGEQRFYRHDSAAIGLPMKFSVFLPRQAAHDGARVPALFFLAGLTCNEETFMIKAGAQRFAAEHGIALIAPDTSPRGANVPGETAAWDFGVGAGFYLDASEAPWATHYRMESYIVDELRALVLGALPIEGTRLGIFGHSMGGHGALTLALRHPGVWRSVSAFAPIAAPMRCAWGEKAFTGYLGEDRERWKEHDASELVARSDAPRYADGILVDQGLADQFLPTQLNPDVFEAACREAGQPLTLRRHEGYDHGYYFISTFIADHLAHHAKTLLA
ncbi:S-formylglutathione hydrolase [Burkholderia gladioli]|jgi:S-formylglutathione hydrolase|uniref:S-formylglutathione hydrolase n=1 Tax=Burkholderia gladioli TaxID=28095 RepID=A0AAW3F5R3_BURGA|nr:S-formylglutathione hydrolase [Burkholderia gladioli]AJW97050.1 S-formylglutathione hydrolase [Burkholderia gladioli]ASD80702.1 S-formylglutathione hydrolase [Burkholderia gladioli pv. gladioli]AWY54064.1 S-formylglutathione hydrolase [Burkholderia gladioli pv. gladioli]KGC16653.1 S-formylglutathione hydrolase [Burkholderia gladioli]MDJ1161034.1 S-formylglutathione hydrolase [Burkholderia gladioli pv. gladioli]